MGTSFVNVFAYFDPILYCFDAIKLNQRLSTVFQFLVEKVTAINLYRHLWHAINFYNLL